MAQALAARAASFGASALLMGGLVLLALTMTYVIQDHDIFAPQPPAIEIAHEPPPPAPPPPTTAARPPAPMEEVIELPIEPHVVNETPTTPESPYVGPVAQAGPVEITAPRWERRPADLARYYPARPLTRGVEGEVLLNCMVRVTGLLDCDVVAETPAGWGFAEAAQRIARAHRMVPAMRDGRAVEGRYVMRVPFQIEQR